MYKLCKRLPEGKPLIWDTYGYLWIPMDTYQYQRGDGDLSETGDKCPTIWLRYAWEQLAGDGAIGSGYSQASDWDWPVTYGDYCDI